MEPRTEDNSSTEGRVLSPEEVAREFLREGADVDRQERKEKGRRRRVRILAGFATAAGVVVMVAVLVLLAVLALIPSHPPSPPRAATVPLPPPTSVKVDVVNANPSGQLLAIATAKNLQHIGFVIGSVSNSIAGVGPSEIFYGPSGLRAAETLAQWLTGSVQKVSSTQLSGNNLELWIANPLLGVNGNTTTTTTTLSPAHPHLRAP